MSAPWLEREDWGACRIRDSRYEHLRGFLWFAVIWTVFTGGLAAVFLSSGKGNLPVLIFPGVGLLLLGAGLYGREHKRKFGTPIFELAAVPVVPGQMLAGLVRTTARIDPEGGFKLRLRCVHRVESGSGKNKRTSNTTLWESEQVMPGGSRREDGIAIPVAFALPADQPETDLGNSRNQIRWSLEVKAALPGVNFGADFDLPVFDPARHGQGAPP